MIIGISVLHVYGYNLASVADFINVFTFDFTSVKHESPNIIAIIVANTFSEKFALCIATELREFLAYDLVKLLLRFHAKVLANLIFEFFERLSKSHTDSSLPIDSELRHSVIV